MDGIRERVKRISEIDMQSLANKYEGFLSVEQVARECFVSTDTINSWIRKGTIAPTVTLPFRNRKIHLFSPEDVADIRERLQIPVHIDKTIRDEDLTAVEAQMREDLEEC